jgi:hypothetical protein
MKTRIKMTSLAAALLLCGAAQANISLTKNIVDAQGVQQPI